MATLTRKKPNKRPKKTGPVLTPGQVAEILGISLNEFLTRWVCCHSWTCDRVECFKKLHSEDAWDARIVAGWLGESGQSVKLLPTGNRKYRQEILRLNKMFD